MSERKIPDQAFVDGKRAKRMAVIDAMPAEMRELVHEYGLTVIRTCTDLGITQPRHIRHLVESILDEFSPTRGSFSKQGKRTEQVSISDSKTAG